LLVGILVVGIVVYMVYRYMLAPPISQEECRGLAVTWCTTCKVRGCLVAAPPAACTDLTTPSNLDSCAAKYFVADYVPRCNGALTWCSRFVSTT